MKRTPLRIAFMGTPDFAVSALLALKDAGHDIAAVYCQPPKPAGRGQHIQPTPVHIAAENLGIEVRTPKTFKDAQEQERFAALGLDIAVVAAYGLILPKAVLSAPKYGCVNIHASLLPRWRGAAPIQRAILAGDHESGITIMQMDAGLDTGDMLIKRATPITPQTSAQSLHDELAKMGAELIVQALDDIQNGKMTPIPQPEDGVTYAAKLAKEEGSVDWTKTAEEIDRQIRALTPWPGCFFSLGDEKIKIAAAEIDLNQSGSPGTLLDDNLTIACGNHSIRLISVQRPGKKATDGASLLRGLRIPVGTSL